MKGSESFKNVISAHLQSVADKDPLFAESYKKPAKNIDDCITYILNTVKASGCNGFADEEIFGMAMHYYDEDDIKVGSPANGRVVVNHHIDGKQAKAEMQTSFTSLPAPGQKPAKKKPAPASANSQYSLFGA